MKLRDFLACGHLFDVRVLVDEGAEAGAVAYCSGDVAKVWFELTRDKDVALDYKIKSFRVEGNTAICIAVDPRIDINE